MILVDACVLCKNKNIAGLASSKENVYFTV
jgi:hypothetical protein